MTNLFSSQAPELKRRRASEARFKFSGLAAIVFAIGFLIVMVGSIAWTGSGALRESVIQISVDLGPDNVDPENLAKAKYSTIVKDALKDRFPDIKKRKDRRKLYGILSPDASLELKQFVLQNPQVVGGVTDVWLLASDDVDLFFKGSVDTSLAENRRKFSDLEIGLVDSLSENNQIVRQFNTRFFLNGDSREPELAGILSSLMGSAFTLLICFAISFPVGVGAAIYLEEFAKKDRVSEFIEVNINNLAAVPSIVFGLLGLAIFLNFFGLPRSSPLVGGMVLALMTLPTIIIASRAALRAVPPSIREAALGLGASNIQTTFHHVAPLALPGMLTGAIVGMARALGETAPLLMIGMVAFIADVPKGIMDSATALPVQIFLWADAPQRGFMEKTSAAIIVLLVFLVLMNILAVIVRRKFERRF
ncbi:MULTISPECIES: phosphate ABC transporter permease PstA [unclassified Lentilitoribacter]|uniref:phosphate ABC transporter permease PstA n=1 Tax=unclassified Lentilitoribacter TaxID=2647570 RepID=UPI0013A6E2D7|nr:phosphate ABC transporter permease PstA [Lentilitoribacter sp. Alg239-R112]